MSDIIHLLPDSVANQIAAGEVIQRPASVIKELVENAIDAEAQNIHVLVTDAGKTCIQVIDDGKGMSETDARLSFERHATSKIREASDLFALRTMGFRGEALASIAAVAQVELKTRPESEELGTKIIIAGSKVESQEAVSCPKGSNFSIKNLFFNIPARRKFLKANSTELSNILAEFERIALVHPEVAFSLYSNDSELFNLPACHLRQRILSVFGKKLNQQLLSVEVNTTMVKVSGYVAKPETARKKGAHQYFFVNGRYMRHPYFHKAVMDAYEQLIPAGEQISYFIYFEVDPANIDVNIHPTKTEIKFENEQAIWQILSASIKESLGKFNAVPSIDFDTEDMPDIPAFEQNLPPAPPKVHFNSDFNPFKPSSSSGGGNYSRPKVDWEDLYGGLEKASKMNQPFSDSDPESEEFAVIEEESIATAAPETLYETYIRKQTLTNCERYITQELKDLEGKIIGAKERCIALEYQMLCKIRESISNEVKRLQKTARALAILDVLASLSEVAVNNNYVCPQITNDGTINIKDGRHPVVEALLEDTPFVPNDAKLDLDENRCEIITGPNMAGKSTYMRQIALITLLAQIGSFVPAKSAQIGIVDAIYTRVGASDDLATGQSTFMVEMNEVAEILKNATSRSLIILDEIGRGTSTFDGMSIARAVLEFVCKKKTLGAKSLFATHYHELTVMEGLLDGVKNYSIAVKKRGDDITFLRKIVKGGADQSFGIEVAKLAGVPDSVVKRAKVILKELEANSTPIEFAAENEIEDESQSDIQYNFTAQGTDEILEILKATDINSITPMEALQTLFDLKQKAQELE